MRLTSGRIIVIRHQSLTSVYSSLLKNMELYHSTEKPLNANR